MSDYFTNLRVKHQSKTVITIYTDSLKDKVGDFVYDSSIKTNFIQLSKLEPSLEIDQSKICIYKKIKFSSFGVTKFRILDKVIEFHVATLEFPLEITGIVGKSFLAELKLPIPEFEI